MSNIVSLADVKSAREPHTAGPLRCLGCAHEWVGVVPSKTVEIECPECRTMKGIRVGLGVRQGEDHWTCKCGNQFFHMVTDGPYCPCCGMSWQWGAFT